MPQVRTALILAALTKVPPAGVGVVLTLHVVESLGYDYGRAGLLGAVATLALAVSAPLRGRLLDRVGLRRTIAPAIATQLVGWSIAPWVGYLPLMAIAFVCGLMTVPIWAIIRLSIMSGAAPSQRKAALSLDSSMTELAFMLGPALGAWLAVSWDTRWTLLAFQLAAVVGGIGLWIVNPSLTAPAGVDRESAVVPAVVPVSPDTTGPSDTSGWSDAAGTSHVLRDTRLLAVLVASAAASFLLVATDMGIVAALRDLGHESAIGWVMSLWAFGSLVGGLAYGAMTTRAAVFWLLGVLALTTAPLAIAHNLPVFAALATLCGVMCAPTIVAAVDTVGRLVPEARRGEAIGWHASAMTAGQGVGAPLIGFAIDHLGWPAMFALAAGLSAIVATFGSVAGLRRRSAAAATPDKVGA